MLESLLLGPRKAPLILGNPHIKRGPVMDRPGSDGTHGGGQGLGESNRFASSERGLLFRNVDP